MKIIKVLLILPRIHEHKTIDNIRWWTGLKRNQSRLQLVDVKIELINSLIALEWIVTCFY